MVKLFYFASVREQLGLGEETLALTPGITTVAKLIEQLATRGNNWQLLTDDTTVLIAVNQQISERSAPLQDGDELAFFPPMTGG